MKSLLLVCLSFSLSSVFAAPTVKTVEIGLYNAIDVDTGTIKAQLVINSNGTLNFKVNTPDFEMPDPGCDGTYAVKGNSFTSNLTCPIAVLPEVSVNIDITAVTPQSVRSAEGALVPVVIDALGTDATMFRLKIVESAK